MVDESADSSSRCQEVPRLLIASHFFAPRNEIAAVRVTNFAAGLSELGWEVHVVTAAPNPRNPLERNLDLGFPAERLAKVRVIEVPSPWIVVNFYRVRSWLSRAASLRRVGFKEQILPKDPASGVGSLRNVAVKRVRGYVIRRANRLMEKAYTRCFARAKGLDNHYDAIWASFGPNHMVETGVALADRFVDASLLIDIRDPIVRRGLLADKRDFDRQRKREALVARRADGVTQVSQHLWRESLEDAFALATIPNGFELSISELPRGVIRKPGEVFVAYYGGRLYPAQDVRPFAAACLILSRSREVRVEYAGPSAPDFLMAFRESGAQHLVVDLGMISRAESLQRARDADVVAVFSWNNSEKGILSGKVFELISVDTPIAVIVAGDHRDSALAEMLEGDPIRRVFGTGMNTQALRHLVDFLEFAAVVPDEVRRAYIGADRYREYSYASLTRRLACFIGEVVDARANRLGR